MVVSNIINHSCSHRTVLRSGMLGSHCSPDGLVVDVTAVVYILLSLQRNSCQTWKFEAWLMRYFHYKHSDYSNCFSKGGSSYLTYQDVFCWLLPTSPPSSTLFLPTSIPHQACRCGSHSAWSLYWATIVQRVLVKWGKTCGSCKALQGNTSGEWQETPWGGEQVKRWVVRVILWRETNQIELELISAYFNFRHPLALRWRWKKPVMFCKTDYKAFPSSHR